MRAAILAKLRDLLSPLGGKLAILFHIPTKFLRLAFPEHFLRRHAVVLCASGEGKGSQQRDKDALEILHMGSSSRAGIPSSLPSPCTSSGHRRHRTCVFISFASFVISIIVA